MAHSDERSVFQAYSRAEISRAEVARRIGREISFGELLLELHSQKLPLPRYPSDPDSPGVRLIRDLASRGQRAG
jgi:hypothetical protein